MQKRKKLDTVSALIDAFYHEQNIFDALQLSHRQLQWLAKGLFQACCAHAQRDEMLRFGAEVYEAQLAFGKFAVVLNSLMLLLDDAQRQQFLTIREIIAEGYAREKLAAEIENMKILGSRFPSGISGEQRTLSEAHITWLRHWSRLVLQVHGDFSALDDETHCTISTWLKRGGKHYFSDAESLQKFTDIHTQIHALAKQAFDLVRQARWFDFMLLYLDVRSFSMRLREQIRLLFAYEQLVLVEYDALTGLGNHIKLVNDLKNVAEGYFLLINLKDFSKANMLYGRAYGDKLLQETAGRLAQTEGVRDAYRTFADEFALILEPQRAQESVQRLLQTSEQNHALFAAMSLYACGGTIDETILERCEYGLLLARQKHRSFIDANELDYAGIMVFAENLKTADLLRAAVGAGRVIPYFQPIVEAKSGAIVKYEALMRIGGRDGEILEPASFMTVLKSMFNYAEATRTMLYKSFTAFETRDEALSVNLSTVDLEEKETLAYLEGLLQRYPGVASRLTIELLETEAVQNYAIVSEFFHLLKHYGVKTALDDFGAGFSNFAYLFNLPIDYVKLDGSIVSKLEHPKMQDMAGSIVQMCHKMGMTVIAEFVKDEETVQKVQAIGVDMMQGYAFGKPAPEL